MCIATSVAVSAWHPHLYVVYTPKYIHSAAYLQCGCAVKCNQVGTYLPDKGYRWHYLCNTVSALGRGARQATVGKIAPLLLMQVPHEYLLHEMLGAHI
jgi:hypothetical protein